jgi:hypothetical protein
VIFDSEIEQKAVELDVSPQNVERDYVHGWLLKEIYAHPRLANLIVLKDGNAICHRAEGVIHPKPLKRI